MQAVFDIRKQRLALGVADQDEIEQAVAGAGCRSKRQVRAHEADVKNLDSQVITRQIDAVRCDLPVMTRRFANELGEHMQRAIGLAPDQRRIRCDLVTAGDQIAYEPAPDTFDKARAAPWRGDFADVERLLGSR